MCVRDDKPADGVIGPDEGPRKAKQYLCPSELFALVSCDQGAHPLAAALRARGVYVYAPWRACCGGDVDLEHGTIQVHKSIDRVRKLSGQPEHGGDQERRRFHEDRDGAPRADRAGATSVVEGPS
jgi:hypothetical protein